MSWANNEAISILWFLLPGFISSGLFRLLISNPKPSGFESVAQVFIFTVIVHVIGGLFFSFWLEKRNNSSYSDSFENYTVEIVFLLLISIVVGILSSLIWNKDWLFKALRKIKITKQSSYRSAQYSAFAFHNDCYVVLHLKNQRRLYGWPKEWPSHPEDQHYLIEDCEWLEENNRIPLQGVSHILVPANEIEMVEFVPINDTK